MEGIANEEVNKLYINDEIRVVMTISTFVLSYEKDGSV